MLFIRFHSDSNLLTNAIYNKVRENRLDCLRLDKTEVMYLLNDLSRFYSKWTSTTMIVKSS